MAVLMLQQLLAIEIPRVRPVKFPVIVENMTMLNLYKIANLNMNE
jgi:hypothetical protein